MNVKPAFLNGSQNEENCMRIPTETESSSNEVHKIRWTKAGAKCWFETFEQAYRNVNFKVLLCVAYLHFTQTYW